MSDYIVILLSAIFLNNFILARFIGLCPFMGLSNRLSTATSMGFAVIFVITTSSIITNLVDTYLLAPNQLLFLRTLVYILVIATFVQLVEMIVKKISPALAKAFGIYLPLITTNCAVLGCTLLNADMKYDLLKSAIHGIGVGCGFSLALILMAFIREKLETAKIPQAFKGAPIAFIITGLLSLIFFAFKGMI